MFSSTQTVPQINTPNRIYYLHTDSEGSVAYWVNGVSAILSSIKQQDEGKAGRYSIKMQITDNKVTDLENEVQKLKKQVKKLQATIDGLKEAGIYDGVDDLKKRIEELKKKTYNFQGILEDYLPKSF